ncbi:histidine kinase [Streptomyces sp. ISL-94]|uniref:sensor histidine kinase n=1 Tax=Streptomyces sp. ISL-94 TaxID=2819190 RepID=UPI001BED1D81|nr:histidine kinase [Streptomyces sp. ISL-94]MBT2478771.1 sensor histidine kinase [Streptomyces sp. ISL-94]
MATSLAAAVGMLTLHSYVGSGTAELLVAGAIVFFAGPLMIAWPVKESLALLLALSVCLVIVANGMNVPRGFVANAALDTLLGVLAFGVTYRFSAWALGVVRELRRTREIQAQLAVAEERLRFARDLHDVLGRNLTVIALKSELAAALTKMGKPSAAAQMAEIQLIARDSQDEMRAVIRGYRNMNLNTELEGARAVLRAAGIDCLIEVEIESQGDLDQETQMALAWVVREGTTNALRHSDAKVCSIRFSSSGETVTLMVENDGVDKTAMPDFSRAGLVGLRERLDTLGGSLQTAETANGRFTLSVHLPKTSRKKNV